MIDRQGIIDQYELFVKPNFDKFVKTQSQRADVITTGTKEGQETLNMIVKHIQDALTVKSLEHRSHLEQLRETSADNQLPETVKILDQTNQVRGVHTIIRNKETCRGDYIFCLERLTSMMIETAVADSLPHKPMTIQTPVAEYHGTQADYQLCGVSIVRGGEIFESSLRSIFRDCVMGKLLIQSDQKTGEPRVHYIKLPPLIKESYVLLFDAQIATGMVALMAVRILLDHDVQEDKILFVTCIASRIGLQTLSRLYPSLRTFSGALDENLIGLSNYIDPGAGNIGQRYFGA